MKSKSGFTLVELAIVLVIIGLIVVAVFQGQALVEQANIRSLIRQVNQINTAMATFKSKYGDTALPGDFRMAEEFGLCPNGICGNTISSSGNKNGDGNGILESKDKLGTARVGNYNGEVANFWPEITNAGLLEGSYTQKDSDCTGMVCNKVGESYPTAKVGTGILVVSDTRVLNIIMGIVGEIKGSIFNNTEDLGTDLTAEQSLSIDTKLDDGLPTTGDMLVFDKYNGDGIMANGYSAVLYNSVTPNDTTTCYNTLSQYNPTAPGNICGLKYRVRL